MFDSIMKVLVGLLLITIAAVHGRTALIENAAAVHNEDLSNGGCEVVLIRTAKSDGTVDRSAGSFISSRWVLTSADSLVNLTFGWMLFCANYAHQPRLVFEFGVAAITSGNNAALVHFQRDPTAHNPPVIPIRLDRYSTVDDLQNSQGQSWYYLNHDRLTATSILTSGSENENCAADGSQGLFCGHGEAACQAYPGTPVVGEDGSQIGLVAYSANCDNGDESSHLVAINIARNIDWIESVTGISFVNPEPDSGSREDVQIGDLGASDTVQVAYM